MAKIFRTSSLITEFDKPGLHLICALSLCLQSPESASVLSLIQRSLPLLYICPDTCPQRAAHWTCQAPGCLLCKGSPWSSGLMMVIYFKCCQIMIVELLVSPDQDLTLGPESSFSRPSFPGDGRWFQGEAGRGLVGGGIICMFSGVWIPGATPR